MIFSPQRNFCFIHIPKTGGTSVEWAYGHSMLFGDIILDGSQSVMSHFYRKELSLDRHASAAQIGHHFGVASFQMMLSFAVIREPVDRLVSYFRWIHSFEHDGSIERELKKIIEFEKFVGIAIEHLAPQCNFVFDTAAEDLLINFLVPFDHINAAWRSLSERLMLRAQLPHRNPSNKNIEVEITDTVRSDIQELYALDVALHKRAMEDLSFLGIDTVEAPK